MNSRTLMRTIGPLLLLIAFGDRLPGHDHPQDPSIHPPIDALIKQLADDDGNRRQEAEARLAALGTKALRQLAKAAAADNAEQARRARRLILRLDNDAVPVLREIVSEAHSPETEQLLGLLLEGLTAQLIRTEVEDLVGQVKAAARDGRFSDYERSYLTSIDRMNVNSYKLDASGRLDSVPVIRETIARLAIPTELLRSPPISMAELDGFLKGSNLPGSDYSLAWERFKALVGEGVGQRALFAEMLRHESHLLALASRAIKEKPDTRALPLKDWPTGLAMSGLHDLRAKLLSRYFYQICERVRRDFDREYPAEFDDETVARFASLMFVEAELPSTLRLPALRQLNSFVSRARALGSRRLSPMTRILHGPQTEREQALHTLLCTALIAADDPETLVSNLETAIRLQLPKVSRKLAMRLANDESLVFTSSSRRAHALLMTAHALLLFGDGDESLATARKLLEAKDQVRFVDLGQVARKHLEVREMALIALLRMLDRQPADIGGVDKTIGECPFSGYLDVVIIEDASRWPEIERIVDTWLSGDDRRQ